MDGSGQRRFEEFQRLPLWWLLPPLAVCVGVAGWAFVQQIVWGRPWGDRPAPDAVVWLLFLLLGLGLPWFLLGLRLQLAAAIEAARARIAHSAGGS